MATVAPSPAPAATPSRNGSASELRSTPWYEVPPAASSAPTSAASTTRGNRSCHTIAWSTGGVAVWKSRKDRWAKIVPTTSPTLMFTGPTAVASSIAPTSTTAETVSGRRRAPVGLFARALIAWRSRHRMLLEGSGNRAQQVDDTRPPPGGDRVVEGDDPPPTQR